MSDLQTVRVEADRLTLRVGRLEADLDGLARGSVRLDGAEYAVASMAVFMEAGHPPRVDMTFYPGMEKDGPAFRPVEADAPTLAEARP